MAFASAKDQFLKKESFKKWGLIHHEPGIVTPIDRYYAFSYPTGISAANNKIRLNDDSTGQFIRFNTFLLPITDTFKTSFTLDWTTKGPLWFYFSASASYFPKLAQDAIQIGFNINLADANINDTVVIKTYEGSTLKASAEQAISLTATTKVDVSITPTKIIVVANGVKVEVANNLSAYTAYQLSGFQTKTGNLTNAQLSNWDIYTMVSLLDRPRYEMTFAKFLELQADRVYNAQKADGSFDNGKDIYGTLTQTQSLITSHNGLLLYKAYQQTGNQKYRTAAVAAMDYIATQQQADGTWNQGVELINRIGRQFLALVLLNKYENKANWSTAITNAKNALAWDATNGKWQAAAGVTSITSGFNAYNQQAYVNAALWIYAIANADSALQTNCENLLTGYLNSHLLACGIWSYDETTTAPSYQSLWDRTLHYSSIILWCLDQMKRYKSDATIWGNATVSTMITNAANCLRSAFPLNFYTPSNIGLWKDYQQTDAPAYMITTMDYHGLTIERDLYIEAFADTWFSQAVLGGSANDGVLDRTFNPHLPGITELSLRDLSQNVSFRYGDVSKRFLY